MNTSIISKSNILASTQLGIIRTIFESLEDLIAEYPNFSEWYWNIVIPDVHNGLRTILIKENSNRDICGISILKHTKEEVKICTFRIIDKYKRLGIGTELMKDTLSLCTDGLLPKITVSEKKIDEFYYFLLKFDFKIYKKYVNYYHKNISEYAFNGPIENVESWVVKDSLFLEKGIR